MKKLIKLSALALTVCFFTACFFTSEPKSIELFNGKNLDGWIGYLDDSSLDPDIEFTVKDGVIHLSGKLGYLHTEKVYSDYKLTAQWRWVDTATNSGIFLRVQPEYKALPENFEFQLKAGHAGDIYNSGGAFCDQSKASGGLVVVKQNPSNEKPVGEWNTAEAICEGNTITVYVNGELQNKITGTSLTEGYVGLQSEGQAIEFRNLVLTPLKK